MKNTIYYIGTSLMFLMLITGLDNWYGEEIKKFSEWILLIWGITLLAKNWQEFKEFIALLVK